MVSKVSSLEPEDKDRRPVLGYSGSLHVPNKRSIFESHSLDEIWFVNAEPSKSCDSISSVLLLNYRAYQT